MKVVHTLFFLQSLATSSVGELLDPRWNEEGGVPWHKNMEKYARIVISESYRSIYSLSTSIEIQKIVSVRILQCVGGRGAGEIVVNIIKRCVVTTLVNVTWSPKYIYGYEHRRPLHSSLDMTWIALSHTCQPFRNPVFLIYESYCSSKFGNRVSGMTRVWLNPSKQDIDARVLITTRGNS